MILELYSKKIGTDVEQTTGVSEDAFNELKRLFKGKQYETKITRPDAIHRLTWTEQDNESSLCIYESTITDGETRIKRGICDKSEIITWVKTQMGA